MMKRIVLFLFAVSFSIGAVASGPYEYNGHTYYLTSVTTWSGAESEAVSLGGHLVSVNDAAEQAFINSLLAGSTWIGFTDENTGVWAWVSGDPVTYTNWSTYEPNGGSIENCGVSEGAWGGLWNDLPCDRLNRGIVEVDLEVDCSTTYSMGLNCPPSGDIQSYMDGLFIQLNGGVGSFDPACPPVSRIFFEWGDGSSENTWFPAPHTYAAPGIHTITVTAFDDADASLAQAQCTVTAESDNPVSCHGFNPPMANYPVKARKNRVFPLKMQLFDVDGFEVTGSDVNAAPLVEVMFLASDEQLAVDVTDDLLNVGQGFDGNQFEYTEDGLWQFNLKSTNYSAPGEYTVTAISGDEGEYSIDPLCVTSFVVN